MKRLWGSANFWLTFMAGCMTLSVGARWYQPETAWGQVGMSLCLGWTAGVAIWLAFNERHRSRLVLAMEKTAGVLDTMTGVTESQNKLIEDQRQLIRDLQRDRLALEDMLRIISRGTEHEDKVDAILSDD